MSEPLLRIAWRRRWIVAAVVLVVAGTAAVVSYSLPKVYTTYSTLILRQGEAEATFDAVQAAQVTARSYSKVLSSPNIARAVAARVGGITAGDIESAVEVEPVAETQLVTINAEASSPLRAKLIADNYAAEFVDYAASALEPTTGAKVALADAAPLPRDASRPRPKLYVLLAILLAIPLGIGAALLRDRRDVRIRDPYELERAHDLPVLGRVPRLGRGEASEAAFQESFRLLRLSLSQGAAADARCIAVISSTEGEGKTTVVHRLALAAVEAGQTVLVVEGDLRRPRLMGLFEVSGNGAGLGLTDYLAGDVSLNAAVTETPIPGVSVLPRGQVETSLAVSLGSGRGASLAANLDRLASLVLIDCPPLDAGADGPAIAARVDGVLVVADLQKSSRPGVIESLRLLRSLRARIVGCVVNRDVGAQPDPYAYPPTEPPPPRQSQRPKPPREVLGRRRQ